MCVSVLNMLVNYELSYLAGFIDWQALKLVNPSLPGSFMDLKVSVCVHLIVLDSVQGFHSAPCSIERRFKFV